MLRSPVQPWGLDTLSEQRWGLVQQDNAFYLGMCALMHEAWARGIAAVWLHPPPSFNGHVSGWSLDPLMPLSHQQR
eukprot:7685700-Pyramimonas_sp.AAC.1